MPMEKTLVILKPDAYVRGLLGAITTSFEEKGLWLVGCKLAQLGPAELDVHYAHLADLPFFPRIREFMMSCPVLLQCWAGLDAVSVVRAYAGSTDGKQAEPGSIRSRYSLSIQCNLLHASESNEAALIELDRFFDHGEILDVQHPLAAYVYSKDEFGSD